ncbi:MAG TPA: hypothetical protein DEG42_05040 [Acholeplasmataceae bacterium]|nr:hypothetical protein [Acholeplasmataceae bacterium]HCB67245.1 hypothetical protein [Acholeplasmataceae bacterium]
MLFKKYIVHIFGFFLVAFGVVGVIYAGRGAAPVDAFNYFVWTLTPLSLGTIAVITGLTVALIAFMFDQNKSMILSILFLFSIGIFIDGWKLVYELLPLGTFDSDFVSYPFALFCIVIIAMGTSITITTGLPSSPFERLMLVLDRKVHSIQYSKMIIEGMFFLLAIILGLITNLLFEQVNVVTILLTLLNGPLVGLFSSIIMKEKNKKGVNIYAIE